MLGTISIGINISKQLDVPGFAVDDLWVEVVADIVVVVGVVVGGSVAGAGSRPSTDNI